MITPDPGIAKVGPIPGRLELRTMSIIVQNSLNLLRCS
jgi:hypothetical protein